MTDEHSGHRDVKRYFAENGTTSLGKSQYMGLEDRTIHSNTVEGYFSTTRPGKKVVYQHCREGH